MNVINFQTKLNLIHECWKPKIIARMNENDFKLVKLQGDFVWHSHPETDEVFILISGQLDIEFRDRTLHLHPGEMTVIPRGVDHKPFAPVECSVLLVEPAGTVNTGNAGGDRTAPSDEWI